MINRIPVPPVVMDPSRLAALDAYAILDTAAEQGFEDIVHLATQLCAVPVALVSLVDQNRQWFKARIGFPTCETDLDRSVCKFVLEEPHLLVIPDLTADPRTQANPLVTGEPHIRFYAGAPLRTPEGKVLGSLCVIDSEPRPEGLTEAQAEALRRLARQTMAQMELRRAVSQKDAALTRLRSSEERYRTIFESATDYAIIGMDLEGNVTNWSAGATQILGWSPDDICGKPAEVFFTPEDRATGIHRQEMHSALTEGRGIDERWHLRKDGELFWANGEMMAVRDEGGAATGFVKILRDRTEQRLGAEALEEAATRLQRAQAAGGVGVFSVTIDDDLLHPTPEFCRLYGVPVRDSYPTPEIEALLLPEDRELVSSTASRTQGDAKEEVEYRILRPNTGEVRWIARTGRIVRDEAGVPIRFEGVSRDITEQRATRAALTESEARYRGLFESMHEGFLTGEIIRDAQGAPIDFRFIAVNLAFSAQSGLPVGTVGRTMREAVPEISQSLIETYARVVDTGTPEVFEIVVPQLGRTFEVRAYREGQQRFAAMFLDATERKHVEVRRAGLLELGDRLRDNTDKAGIARIAAEVLGRTLDLSHAGYGIVDAERETILVEEGWTAPGLASISGLHQFREYGSYIEDLRVGRPVTISDVRSDPRTVDDAAALTGIDVCALYNLPVMERDRFVAVFYVAKRTPSEWPAEDIGFVRNVSDRTRAAIARIEAEEQQRLLNHELSHRMKNLLAMVQSIATQTMRGASDIDTAKEVLAGRLIALGKAHDLLMGGALTSTQMAAVIRGAVDVHADRPDRFRISGPALEIGPDRALSLALMLHELATNAAKYGALTSEGGYVGLRWEVMRGEAEPQLRLSWIEVGGPEVTPPTRKGFGSRFIERGLASQVDGDLILAYPPTGVTCTLTAPLAAFQATPALTA